MPNSPQVDTLTQMRFIVSYFWQGCEAPYYLYIEHSQEPVKDLLLLFLSFDLQDFTKQMFRPEGMRSKRHGRKGRKSRPRGGGIPDVSDGYGDRVRPYFSGWTPEFRGGTRALYVIGDQIDRFNWTLAEIEGVSDFGFETLWGVIEDDRAQCDNIGRFMRHDDGGTYGIPHDRWIAFGFQYEDYAKNCTSSNGFGVFFPNAKWVVTAAVTLRGSGAFGATGVKLGIFDGNDELIAESSTVSLAVGEEVDLIFEGTVKGPNSAHVRIWLDTGFVYVPKCNWNALQVII